MTDSKTDLPTLISLLEQGIVPHWSLGLLRTVAQANCGGRLIMSSDINSARDTAWEAIREIHPMSAQPECKVGLTLADEVERLQTENELLLAIVRAAWLVRTEERDYTPVPDLALRADHRKRLHVLLDQWKAAEAAGGEG